MRGPPSRAAPSWAPDTLSWGAARIPSPLVPPPCQNPSLALLLSPFFSHTRVSEGQPWCTPVTTDTCGHVHGDMLAETPQVPVVGQRFAAATNTRTHTAMHTQPTTHQATPRPMFANRTDAGRHTDMHTHTGLKNHGGADTCLSRIRPGSATDQPGVLNCGDGTNRRTSPTRC